MINNVSFGKTYLVTTEDNDDKKYECFKSYCKIKNEMTGKSLYSEPSHLYSKYQRCALEVPKCMEPGVEDFCKIQGIKFSTME